MDVLNLETVKAIPHDIRMEKKMDSGIVSRTSCAYGAVSASNSPTSNNVLSIPIPSLGWVDFSHSDITGYLSWTSSDVNAELCGSVHSLFRRWRILAQNGQVLFDTDNYDLLANSLQDYTLNSDQQQGILGITSVMNDSIRKVKTGVQFSFKPLISMLRSSIALPLHLIGGITCEAYLQDARVCFKATDDITYQTSDVKYVLDVLSFDEQTGAVYRNAFQNNQLHYYYNAWACFPFQSQSATVDIRYDTSKNSLDSLLVLPRDSTRIVDKAVNSYGRTQGSLFSIDITCGTNCFATLDIAKGNSQGLFELEKVLDSSMQSTVKPWEWSNDYAALTSPSATYAKNSASQKISVCSTT